MTYNYRRARFDYGPRKGTLGLALHMSEGNDELVDYLANNPARGVSANFAVLSDGQMWRMLPFENASGSLNPADRSTEKGYFGHSFLVDVLGDHWTDPNTWCVSLEIAGHAVTGPTPRQVESIVAWAADMKAMSPSIRGAFGHADQTDTKRCPGTTPAMKSIFERIGGHGLWQQGDTVTTVTQSTYPPRKFSSKAGVKTLRRFSETAELDAITAPYSGTVDADVSIEQSDGRVPHGSGFLRLASGGSEGLFIQGTAVDVVVPADPVADAVKAAVAIEHESNRKAAIDAVGKAIP